MALPAEMFFTASFLSVPPTISLSGPQSDARSLGWGKCVSKCIVVDDGCDVQNTSECSFGSARTRPAARQHIITNPSIPTTRRAKTSVALGLDATRNSPKVTIVAGQVNPNGRGDAKLVDGRSRTRRKSGFPTRLPWRVGVCENSAGRGSPTTRWHAANVDHVVRRIGTVNIARCAGLAGVRISARRRVIILRLILCDRRADKSSSDSSCGGPDPRALTGSGSGGTYQRPGGRARERAETCSLRAFGTSQELSRGRAAATAGIK
jgi:hypothetical protein